MQILLNKSSNRLIFLDNLRYFFVLCVVLQHASNAYGGLSIFGNWWPVLESKTSPILGTLNMFLNGITMPLLFFIAGYFTLPTIQKHGSLSFIKGKFKRLGIPWLVCILTICPVLPLIYHFTRDGLILSTSYLDLWVILMKNFLQFTVGVIPSMNDLMNNNGFYQRYMWFISLLLLFFVVFSILYKLKKTWFDFNISTSETAPSIKSNLKLLGLIGLISYVGEGSVFAVTFLLTKNASIGAWFSLGNVVQFQLMLLPLYIIYFVLGIIMCKNRWIEKGKFPGNFKFWMISFVILTPVCIFFMHGLLTSPRGSAIQDVYGNIYGLIYVFSLVSILGFAMSLSKRYWNHPGKLAQSLAENSYNIYLSHYIFVLISQLLLLMIPGIPILLKFVIVSVMSIIFAYISSRFLIKPFPKATVTLLFVSLIVMFYVIKP